jgi:hypothetical protein
VTGVASAGNGSAGPSMRMDGQGSETICEPKAQGLGLEWLMATSRLKGERMAAMGVGQSEWLRAQATSQGTRMVAIARVPVTEATEGPFIRTQQGNNVTTQRAQSRTN